jgi:hypothetical protein
MSRESYFLLVGIVVIESCQGNLVCFVLPLQSSAYVCRELSHTSFSSAQVSSQFSSSPPEIPLCLTIVYFTLCPVAVTAVACTALAIDRAQMIAAFGQM